MTVGQLLVNMGINLAPLQSGATQVLNVFSRIRAAGVQANQSLQQSFNFGGAQQGIGTLTTAVGGLQRAIAGIVAGRAASELASLSDTAILLNSRVRNVTKSEEEFAIVNEKLFNIAQRTRTSLEGVVTIYTRLARSNDQIGASQEQLLRITETLNKTTIVYGNTTQEAQGALIQLSQAISSARLGGDELRTILEQLPPVAKAIAKEMGVTVGVLRDLGRAGKITPQIVAQAVLNMGDEIDKQFKNIPTTIGQAFTQLGNQSLKTVENLNRITDAGPLATRAIQGIVDAMQKAGDPTGPLNRGIEILVEFGNVDLAFKKLEELKDEAAALTKVKISLDTQGLDTTVVRQKLIDVNFEIDRVATLLGSKIPQAAKEAKEKLRAELSGIQDQIADLEQQIQEGIKFSRGNDPALKDMIEVLKNLKAQAEDVKRSLAGVGDKIPDAVDTADQAFAKAIKSAKELGKAIDALDGKDIPIELKASVDSLTGIRQGLVQAVEDAKIPDKKIKALINLADFDREVRKIPDPVAQRKIGLEVDTKSAISEAKKFVDGIKAIGDKPVPVEFEAEADSLIQLKEQLIQAVEDAPTPKKKIEAVAALDDFLTALRALPDPILKRKILGELELSDEEAKKKLESFKIRAEAEKVGINLDLVAPDINAKLTVLEEKIARFTRNKIPVPVELLLLRDQYNIDLKNAVATKAEQNVDLKLKFDKAETEAEIARFKAALPGATSVQMSLNLQEGIDRGEAKLAKFREEEAKDPVKMNAVVDDAFAKAQLEALRKQAEAIGNVAHGGGQIIAGTAASSGDIQKILADAMQATADAVKSKDTAKLTQIEQDLQAFLRTFEVAGAFGLKGGVSIPSDVGAQVNTILNAIRVALGSLGGAGISSGSPLTAALEELRRTQAAGSDQTNSQLQQGNDIARSSLGAMRDIASGLRSGSFASDITKQSGTNQSLSPGLL